MKKITKITTTALLTSSILLGSAGGLLLTKNSNNQVMDINKTAEASILAADNVSDIGKIEYQGSNQTDNFFAIVKDANGGADRLYAWGRGSQYLGLNKPTLVPTFSPQLVKLGKPGVYNIVKVVTEATHTLLLTSDGDVWATGRGNDGQLGIAGLAASLYPLFHRIPPSSFGGEKIIDIAVGNKFSMAMSSTNIYFWGNNLNIHNDGSDKVPVPVITHAADFPGSTFSSIQAYEDTVAVNTDNGLWLWGDNKNNILGDMHTASSINPFNPSGATVVQSFSLGKNVFISTSNGTSYAWGNNEAKQIKNSTSTLLDLTAIGPSGSRDFKTFEQSVLTYSASAGGVLQSIGYNEYGQLGLGDTESRSSWTSLESPEKYEKLSLIAGPSTLFVKSATGKLFVTGDSSDYQYGIANPDISYKSLQPITLFKGKSSSDPIALSSNADVLTSDAYDDLYGSTKVFQYDKVNKYFDLSYFPTSTVFSGATIPKFDAVNGTLSFSLTADRYFDGIDGVLTPTPTTFKFDATNFKSGVNVSSIAPTATPPTNIKLNGFNTYFGRDTTTGEVSILTNLKNFLNLNNFPTDTKFYLRNEELGLYDPITFTRNKISYNLFSSKYYPTTNPSDLVTTEKDWGKFTFTSLPQHQETNFISKIKVGEDVGYTPNTFLDKLISDGATHISGENYNLTTENINFLKTYIDFISPVSSATYTLKVNEKNNRSGVFKFAFNPSKAYDAVGVEQSAKTFNLDFKLNQLSPASTIEVIENQPADIELNDIESYFGLNSSGVVTNLPNFEKFLKLNNFPANTSFTLKNKEEVQSDENYIINSVSFEVSANAYYEEDVIEPIQEELQLGRIIFKTAPYHLDTAFNWKGDNLGYSPVTFLNKLIEGGATIDDDGEWSLTPTNIEFLKTLFEFVSQVPNTEYRFDIISVDHALGSLYIYIIPSAGWEGGISRDGWYRLNKWCAFQPSSPSEISIKESYSKTLTPSEFRNAVTTNGSTVKRSEMANYIQNIESIPYDSNITLKNYRTNEPVDGLIDTVTFDLTFSKWISETKQVVENTITGFSLTLAPQHAATAYKANADVPKDITPSAFIENLITNGMEPVADAGLTAYKLSVANIEFLSKVGKFTSKIENSTWWLVIIRNDDTTGVLNIMLKTDMLYKADGSEQGSLDGQYATSIEITPQTFDLARDIDIPPKTEIITKPDSPEITSENAFLDSLKNTDGGWNLDELAKYVDGLNTIPTLANIVDITLKTETDGKYVFEIKVSGWWNGVTNVMEPETNYSFQVKSQIATPTSSETDQMQWWAWVLIALAVILTFGGFGWWYFKFKKNGTHKTAETSKTKITKK